MAETRFGQNEFASSSSPPHADPTLEGANLPVLEDTGVLPLEADHEFLRCAVRLRVQPGTDNGPYCFEGILSRPVPAILLADRVLARDKLEAALRTRN